MARLNRKALRLCAVLVLSGSLRADSPPLSIVLLLDVTRLGDHESFAKTQEVCRDIIRNLPPNIRSRTFLFGPGSDFAPFDPLSLDENQNNGSMKAGEATIHEVLLRAENILCQRREGEDSSKKVLVLIGASGGNAALILSGRCRISVFAIDTEGANDEPLRRLAESTHGRYDRLDQARGYILADEMMSGLPPRNSVASEGEYRPHGISHWMLWVGTSLAAMVLLLWALLRRRKSHEKSHVEDASLAAKVPGKPCLRISGGGSAGDFNLSSLEPVVLGGKQHASPLADLLIPDQAVAPEHCRIYAEGEVFFVVDLASQGGTFVNGERITAPRHLMIGDLLQVGGTSLLFAISGGSFQASQDQMND
jgi:hypothetical protein